MVTAGWGKPANARPDAEVHWYRSSGERACGEGLSYIGPRSMTVALSEACGDCLEAVLESCRVLGIPMGQIMDAFVGGRATDSRAS